MKWQLRTSFGVSNSRTTETTQVQSDTDTLTEASPPPGSKHTQKQWDKLSLLTRRQIHRGARINAAGIPARRKCDLCEKQEKPCIFPPRYSKSKVCGHCAAGGTKCTNAERTE